MPSPNTTLRLACGAAITKGELTAHLLEWCMGNRAVHCPRPKHIKRSIKKQKYKTPNALLRHLKFHYEFEGFARHVAAVQCGCSAGGCDAWKVDEGGRTEGSDARTEDEGGTEDEDAGTEDEDAQTEDEGGTEDEGARTEDEGARTEDEDARTEDEDARTEDEEGGFVLRQDFLPPYKNLEGFVNEHRRQHGWIVKGKSRTWLSHKRAREALELLRSDDVWNESRLSNEGYEWAKDLR